MKLLSALTACVVLAAATPALAQNTSDPAKGLQQNGSPNGADASHAKQPGASDAGAGKHDMSEGRSSATDSTGKMDGANGSGKSSGQ
jgi:hypothetical protein